MRLIPDTHAVLWWLSDDARLSASAAAFLGGGQHDVLISAVVSWEIALERSLGKLTAPHGLLDGLLASGAHALPVTHAHAEGVGALPWHHRDPFDRLLVSQAICEGAAILSRDPVLHAYAVPVVW